MVKCCGENRNTPFCPMCGAKLREEHPLLGLLKHISASRKSMEGSLATRMRQEAENPDDDYYEFSSRQKALMQNRIAKWTLWETELGKLLESQS